MIKDLLGIKPKKRPSSVPSRETKAKIVTAERFNEMIEYYTNELKSRLDEIKRLKEENEMLIKTSIKSAAHADESRLQARKLQEDIRVMQQRMSDKKS
ncbi:hypothetical protein KY363_04575 [Candidatus Woesearchaeota archaeon]|nr:hypothetical protein [Candidatus Woesearchaeota archaeon]